MGILGVIGFLSRFMIKKGVLVPFWVFSAYTRNRDGSGWERQTERGERQETSSVIAELKELRVSLTDSTLYLLKEQRGLCLLGWRGLFNDYTNQRSGLWLWFFSQLIPQLFTFSKFIFFMISLISSFHLLIWVFWVSFLLKL